MFCVRLAAILVLMMMITGVTSEDGRCDHLSQAWSGNSSWITDAEKKILYWIVKSQSRQPPACRCPTNGGLNDILRIQTTTTSYTICTGCPGVEAVATDVKFCTDSYVSSSGTLSCRSTFGPCTGVTVYRCSCPQPTTKGFTIFYR